ncbi:rCG41505 [Rattus norvegicus]|uniref:RCG41505 n=1 Tax=Rattus norvegicus TaxID=10116 RepID=A6IHJ2_RAT|nr:rCG41505 [Rattus norvegicus]
MLILQNEHVCRILRKV